LRPDKSIIDILGHSWRLFRLNIDKVVLYTIIPTIIYEVGQLLIGLPSVVISKPEMYLISTFCFCPLGLFSFLLGLFVSVYFNFAQFKAFYKILTKEPFNYKNIIKETIENFTKITKLALLITLQLSILGVVLFVLLIIAYIIVLLLISTITFSFKFQLLSKFVFFELLLLFYYFLITIFSIIFSLEIVIMCVEECSVSETLKRTFKILLSNWWRFSVFTLSLSLLYYILVLYFNIPAFALMFFEMFKGGINFTKDFSLPVLVITSVWSSIINILLWPLLASGVSMFYYYIKVRNEGYDLKLNLMKNKI
jgi:hypothetical protein